MMTIHCATAECGVSLLIKSKESIAAFIEAFRHTCHGGLKIQHTPRLQGGALIVTDIAAALSCDEYQSNPCAVAVCTCENH